MSSVTHYTKMVSEDNGSSTFLGSGQSVQRLPVELGLPRTSSRIAKQPKGSSLRASAPPFAVSTELKLSVARISQNTKLSAHSELDTAPEPVGIAVAPWLQNLTPSALSSQDLSPSYEVSFVPGGGFELTERTERLPSDGVKFEASESELLEGIYDLSVMFVPIFMDITTDITYMPTLGSCSTHFSGYESDCLMSGK
jgi:hypothetical protein